MTTIYYIIVLIAAFAGVRRLSIPACERAPIPGWCLHHAYFNVRPGLSFLSTFGLRCPFIDDVEQRKQEHPSVGEN
ncbi:hypothetical protein [Pseudarthrobacter sp. NPDC057230]|uniref:hypothetical protein n=1 Tax=Pseudarthrobacter sp. NPDC057230 TaxID=3346057 RepID=UPI0036406287